MLQLYKSSSEQNEQIQNRQTNDNDVHIPLGQVAGICADGSREVAQIQGERGYDPDIFQGKLRNTQRPLRSATAIARRNILRVQKKREARRETRRQHRIGTEFKQTRKQEKQIRKKL